MPYVRRPASVPSNRLYAVVTHMQHRCLHLRARRLVAASLGSTINLRKKERKCNVAASGFDEFTCFIAYFEPHVFGA